MRNHLKKSTFYFMAICVACSLLLVVIGTGCGSKKKSVKAEDGQEELVKNKDGTFQVTNEDGERPSDLIASASVGSWQPTKTGVRLLSNNNGVYSWVDSKGNINISRRRPTGIKLKGDEPNPDIPGAKIYKGEEAKTTTAKMPRSSISYPTVLSAQIEKVLSGDRVRVGGQEVKLLGITSPRPYEKGGPEALKYHRALIEGKHVNIVLPPGERVEPGELPEAAFVFLDKLTFVNAELIRNGHAWASKAPDTKEYRALFIRLEERARAHHRGMWQ